MKNTQRGQTRKSHTWWWDSHISPQNSKWLSENTQEMEKQVKEMLGLIEEGDFSAENAEAFCHKQPLLTTQVDNFHRMYCALAERYDSLTAELRKNIPSSMKSHGSDVSSDVSKKGSEGSTSSSESDSELDETKEENGSIFYALSQKVIELEDELHEAREKINALEEKNGPGTKSKVSEHEEKMQTPDMESNNPQNDLEVNSENEALEAILLEHRNEIEVLKESMASAAKQFEVELAHRDLEIENCRRELGVLSDKYLHDKSTLEAELRNLQGVNKDLEGEIAKMSQEKLHLESRIEELDQEAHSLEHSSSEIVKLQEVIRNTQAELEKVTEENRMLKEHTIEFEQLHSDFEASVKEVGKLTETIQNLEGQLERALEEKSILQDRVKELDQVICDSLEKHSQEKSSLSADILKLSEANASLERKLSSIEAELMQVYVDKEEESLNSENQISVLNQDLANLRTKLELLSSEKATVDDKLADLLTDIASRDEKMKKMDDYLNQLQLENSNLKAESEAANKSLSELRARISGLEEEVEKQKLLISESAEGKREAIRQLCFSLDHYRSGYQQLREVLQSHRRPLVMAT